MTAAFRDLSPSVARASDRAVLEIFDDGIGLTSAPGRAGHGLANMAVRAKALDGELRFDPGNGGRRTTVWLGVRL